MKRRDFLKYSGSGLVLPTIAGKVGFKAYGMSKLAQALNMVTDTDHVLVMIYLSGGNDGLNTVVPLDQMSALSSARPHVILPESSLLNLDGTEVGLHPGLTGFQELYNQDRLQIIQNVGYPNQDFSHFRSTDIWMSGSSSNELVNSGWTGRYLNYEYENYPVDYPNETMPDPLAIEIGWSSSLLFQGPSYNMGMVITNPENFYQMIENEVTPAPNTNAGERLEYVRLIAQQSQEYGITVKNAAEKVTQQVEYPDDNELAQKLKIVSRLIAGGLKTRLYMVEIGGFDTHDAQVDPSDHTQGYHAMLMNQLSEATKVFMDDCDFQGTSDRVMGMTFSEFGRRIISNASDGTDHGAAAPLFLFGNHVAAGVTGSNPNIPLNANWNSNVEMEHDFREVYASVFEQWLCMPKPDINDVLFDNFNTIPVVNGSPCIPSFVHEENIKAGYSYIKVSPNPVVDITQIEFESIGSSLQINLYSLNGKKIKTLVNGNFPEGKHKMSFNASELPSGNYFVSLHNQNFSQSKKLVKL